MGHHYITLETWIFKIKMAWLMIIWRVLPFQINEPFFWSLHIYVCLFPCCILLFVNWEPLVFLVFLTHHNICFVLWNVLHDKDRKFSYTTHSLKGSSSPLFKASNPWTSLPFFKIFVSPPPPIPPHFSVPPPFKVFQTVPLTLTLLPLTLIQYTNLPYT